MPDMTAIERSLSRLEADVASLKLACLRLMQCDLRVVSIALAADTGDREEARANLEKLTQIRDEIHRLIGGGA